MVCRHLGFFSILKNRRTSHVMDSSTKQFIMFWMTIGPKNIFSLAAVHFWTILNCPFLQYDCFKNIEHWNTFYLDIKLVWTLKKNSPTTDNFQICHTCKGKFSLLSLFYSKGIFFPKKIRKTSRHLWKY